MAVRKKKGEKEITLLDALKDICTEREIPEESLFEAVEAALVLSYRKVAGDEKDIGAEVDREQGNFRVFENYTVVEEVENPDKEISLDDAQKINPELKIGDVYQKEVPVSNFGRIAAQAAKQCVMQKIREAERGIIYDEFNGRENDVVSGTVTRVEDGNVIVDIGKTEAILFSVEQMPGEHYKQGDRVRAYISEVRKIGKGPQIFLSRTHPGFLRRLFEMEVPEIQEGLIVVKSVSREAGNRSKIAVYSQDESIDAVGSCVGQHGIRVQAIMDELGAEKIDIVEWNEEPAIFIANALSPSRVFKVAVNDEEKVSRVIVPDNQLSLAIGKEGQNARLAARLTGWKIDIKSKTQAKDLPPEEGMRQVKIAKAKGGKKR